MNQDRQRDFPSSTIIQLPEPYLTAIGRVCVQWSQLEATADLMLRKMMGFDIHDPRGYAITPHMSWPLKMDILSSLIEMYIKDHPHLSAFSDVQKMLKTSQDSRNRIIHAQWHFENGNAYMLRATARKRFKTNIDPISVNEINEISSQIGATAIKLYQAVLNPR